MVHPPSSGLYRVGRGPGVFDPPDWELAGHDGTFGNRFDDPGAMADLIIGRPELSQDQRFRVIYCSTQRAGAFGETLARFRPALDLMAMARAVDDPLDLDPVLFRPTIPADWRSKRRLGFIELRPDLQFVEIHHGATVHALRSELAPLLASLDLEDLDLSRLTSSHRRLTQEIARYIFEQTNESGVPEFAGIKYISRLHHGWECWALFSERVVAISKQSFTIFPDDEGLLQAARILGLNPPDAF